MKAMPANHSRIKKTRKNGLRIIALAVMILFGVIAYSRSLLVDERDAKEKQYNELVEQQQEEEERSLLLAERRAYMQTIRYIEEMAREKLGLVYKDEIIFRPQPEEEE